MLTWIRSNLKLITKLLLPVLALAALAVAAFVWRSDIKDAVRFKNQADRLRDALEASERRQDATLRRQRVEDRLSKDIIDLLEEGEDERNKLRDLRGNQEYDDWASGDVPRGAYDLLRGKSNGGGDEG